MKRARDDGAQSMRPSKTTATSARSSQLLSQNKLTTNDALSYLREVKVRFADQKEVYDTFLEIMKEFKAQRIDTGGVIVRVKQLFKGHRELILGFNTFLPKGYEIELARISDDEMDEDERPDANKQPVEFDQAINYVNKIKTRFANDERVYKAFLEILNMYRKGQKTINNVYEEVAVLFRNHNDLLSEFTYFLPDNSQPQQPNRRATAIRPGGRPQPSRAPSSPGQDLRYMHKRKAAKKAEEGFRRGYDDYEEPRAKPVLNKQLHYFERVKQKLRNKDAYNDLLKCLNLYTSEIISRNELLLLVSDIFSRIPELVSGFHEFLHKCETMDVEQLVPVATVPPPTAASQRDMLRQKQMQKDKFLTKPLSEIVAHETERITPSYVPVPSGYPKLRCSGRTPLGNEVLNDILVNVITGSEDYSFKLMRKNQYEEALFRCEDDRYEFEMCIETNLSAMRALCPIAEKLLSMSPEEKASFRLQEDALSPIHIKAIERLYADSGPAITELLRKNPAVTVPVLLSRMEQKDLEWRKVKDEMTKTWRKIYEQNYHKSLDHRSFYFKQAEKKLLLSRTMVMEIKEVADRRKQDEWYLRTLSLAHRYESASGKPDLVYDYSDKLVLNDCYQILRLAISESLGPGQREEVLELYLQMVEPLLGLPVRSEELSRLRVEAVVEEAAGKTGKRMDSDPADAKSDSDEQADEDQFDETNERKLSEAPAGQAETPEPTVVGVHPPHQDPANKQAGLMATLNEPCTNDQGEMEDDSNNVAQTARSAGNGAAPQATAEAAAGRSAGNGAKAAAAAEDSVTDNAESTDEHPGRSYDCCKPLAPYLGLQHELTAQATCSNRLLFGNENIYIFFRYHRHLYERLITARKCCLTQSQQKNQQYRQQMTPLRTDDETSEAQAAQNEAQVREDSDKLHASFMSMVQQVLQGELDLSVYEDQCRSMLGTNSYELFTLDKLIHRLINHMRLMVQDEPTLKLWELCEYEHQRSTGIHPTAYHINCHTILDDICYRIEYLESDQQLGIQMVDSDKTDAFASAEGCLTEYITSFVSGPPSPRPEHLLYLPRNMSQRARQFTDEAVVDALKSVEVYNGLECKISCIHSKISYVLDTEDVMCRKKGFRRREAPSQKQARLDRFERWMKAAVTQSKAEKEAVLALTAQR